MRFLHDETMRPPEYVAGAIYDVDDTLLDNQQDSNPLSNLHQVARLAALQTIAKQPDGKYADLLTVEAQENYDCFALSPVHTVAGAFYTLLKNRGILSGDIDPNHSLILQLIELKNTEYAKLLMLHGKPVKDADTFVRDFASHFNIEDKNAVASTAILADIQTFLDMHNLAYLFPDERIVDVARVEHPKPHPEAFDKAFLSLGLPEHERGNVVAFEDDPRGMLSARKAGLYVCGITTRYSKEFLMKVEARPDYVADSFQELRGHFRLPQ